MTILICLLSLLLLSAGLPAAASAQDRVSTATQNEPLPSQLRLGVTRSGWMPFISTADARPLQGVSGEAVQDFARQAGVRIEVVPFDNFQQLLIALQQGKIDFTSDIFATPERRRYFRFTEPYTHSHHGIIIHQESSPVFSLAGLSGKTVAIEKGFYHANELRSLYPKPRLPQVDSTEDALRAVSSGLADAYVGNLEVANYLINTQGIPELRVSTTLQSDLRALSFAVRNDLPALQQALDRFIEAGQQSHYFDRLWVKWSAYQNPSFSHLLVPYRGHGLGILTAGLLMLSFLFYRLRRMRRQRDLARQDLDLILQHNTQGVIASDANRQLRFLNRRACCDFNLCRAKGSPDNCRQFSRYSKELDRTDLYHLVGSQLLEDDLGNEQRQRLLRAVLNNQPLQLRLAAAESSLDLHYQPLPGGGALLHYSRLGEKQTRAPASGEIVPLQAWPQGNMAEIEEDAWQVNAPLSPSAQA